MKLFDKINISNTRLIEKRYKINIKFNLNFIFKY